MLMFHYISYKIKLPKSGQLSSMGDNKSPFKDVIPGSWFIGNVNQCL